MLPVGFDYSDSLDAFSAFYVNKYIDHHPNEIAFCRRVLTGMPVIIGSELRSLLAAEHKPDFCTIEKVSY
jgi:hypothetical protein